jgi:hypothetical protein
MNRKSWQVHPRIRGVREILVRLAKAREGIEALEFAIILPVLLAFLLGCIEFGRLFWTQSELQFAVEAASRCVTVTCSTTITGSGPGTYAADNVFGISVPAGAVFSVTNPSPACGNEVTVCFPFEFMVPGLFPFSNTPPASCPKAYNPPALGLTLIATGCHQA